MPGMVEGMQIRPLFTLCRVCFLSAFVPLRSLTQRSNHNCPQALELPEMFSLEVIDKKSVGSISSVFVILVFELFVTVSCFVHFCQHITSR